MMLIETANVNCAKGILPLRNAFVQGISNLCILDQSLLFPYSFWANNASLRISGHLQHVIFASHGPHKARGP